MSDEERWDLINYLRALASGERARNFAPVIDDQPWLVAPDFNYETNTRENRRTLKDHRGNKIVLLDPAQFSRTLKNACNELGSQFPLNFRPLEVEIVVVVPT